MISVKFVRSRQTFHELRWEKKAGFFLLQIPYACGRPLEVACGALGRPTSVARRSSQTLVGDYRGTAPRGAALSSSQVAARTHDCAVEFASRRGGRRVRRPSLRTQAPNVRRRCRVRRLAATDLAGRPVAKLACRLATVELTRGRRPACLPGLPRILRAYRWWKLARPSDRDTVHTGSVGTGEKRGE